MDALTALRSQRGHLITLKEMRYINVARLDELETQVTEKFDELSKSTVEFLLGEEAFGPLEQRLDTLLENIQDTTKTADLPALTERVEAANEGLTVLSEVIAGLEVDDPTRRTEILERISEVFGRLNRVRAILENKRRELLSAEGRAEFAAQFKPFSQAVTSAVSLANTPEACEEQLSRLMVQLEELEARFSEFDELTASFRASAVGWRRSKTTTSSTRFLRPMAWCSSCNSLASGSSI